LVLDSNLTAILPHFRDISTFVRREPRPYHTSILAKISGCSPWSRCVMLGSADSEHPRLTNREFICEDFQPM